jgi:hypothetical protein
MTSICRFWVFFCFFFKTDKANDGQKVQGSKHLMDRKKSLKTAAVGKTSAGGRERASLSKKSSREGLGEVKRRGSASVAE